MLPQTVSPTSETFTFVLMRLLTSSQKASYCRLSTPPGAQDTLHEEHTSIDDPQWLVPAAQVSAGGPRNIN